MALIPHNMINLYPNEEGLMKITSDSQYREYKQQKSACK